MKSKNQLPSLRAGIFMLALMLTVTFSYGQNLQTSYFAHGGYTAKLNNDENVPNQSAFNSGGLDILLTSQISENFSAIGELFTGYRGDGSSSVVLSVERLYFKYYVKDYLTVSVGRMYTPLGFWQSRYSQAQFFAPTINAPYPVRTKADKGIIPTNSVALQFSGDNMGKLRFGYFLMIDNSTGAPSLNTDNTLFKALSGKLKIEPSENLEVFVSGRSDKLIAGSQSVSGQVVPEDIDQQYFNIGLVQINPSNRFEFAAEYYHVINKGETTGTNDNNFLYGYMGYKIKKFTPYLQYDRLLFSDNDPTYSANDLTGMVVGGRYSIASSAVIKMEYKFRGTETLKHQDVLSVQVSARF